MLSGNLPFNYKNKDNKKPCNSLNNNMKSKNNSYLQNQIINEKPKDIDNISEEAKNLLKGLLNKNPLKRLTCEEILNHPWLKNSTNFDSFNLFTKAEMTMMSQTYIDYRKGDIEDLKENFTLSNLFIDDKNKNNKNEKNEETKSSILAPFNSVYENHNNVDDDFYEDEIIMDDFNNKKIRLENEIISIGNKVKEYNMLYEMNNNCEVDNGIIINSKTNTLTTVSNKSLISLADSFTDMLLKKENKKDKEKENKKNKNIYDNNFSSYGILQEITDESHNNDKYNENNDNINQINNILNQIELLGYNKQYVQECIKNNVLCHASTAYFLMLNYDKI
jgi:serine/threonine protein kinase